MNNKVLVFCPYYRTDEGDSIRPETSRYLDRLERLGYSVLRLPDPQPYDPSTRIGRYRNHHRQFVNGFDLFRSSSFTHLLTLEHDMLPPGMVIPMLLSCKADCAYAPYRFRYGNRLNTNILKVYKNRNDRNIGEPYTVNELSSLTTRRIIPCSGSAFGCTLFSKRAIETLDLSFDETRPNYFDTTVTKRLWRNRSLIFRTHLRAKSKHYDSENQKWLEICPSIKP